MAEDVQPLSEDRKKQIDAQIQIPNKEEWATQEEVDSNFDSFLSDHGAEISKAIQQHEKGNVGR